MKISEVSYDLKVFSPSVKLTLIINVFHNYKKLFLKMQNETNNHL